ncbi:MAG: family 16 glycoside hydrolase [Planctomycetota bacterium]
MCELQGVHRNPRSFWLGAACMCLLPLSIVAQSRGGAEKTLPMPGEVFAVEGRTAFLILPSEPRTRGPGPWVWYAPTLPGLPAEAEKWMFERFLAAGIAIAGVDVGESYGSPSGRTVYSALYEELVQNRGLAARACLLARSRGGLMLYNWAAEHPESVACIAGIYPVCNLESYPGLARACAAYEMTEAQLALALRAHNPIDRLTPLAKARVPILHLHGDSDRVVPLATNSAELQQRYAQMQGTMVLKTIEGRGHDMWRGWFESQELIDFVIEHARARSSAAAARACDGTTKGIIHIGDDRRPAGAVPLVGSAGSKLVPEDTGVECRWVFEHGVLTASPQWDSVVTTESYRDFHMHLEFNVNEAAGPDPEANGNSGVYIQQRYELQILDSYGVAAKDYKTSDCGSLYRLKKPDRLVNKKAGEWQSFDIAFRAARYAGDEKTENARITVYQNQQLIHDDCEIPHKTGAGKDEGLEPRPIKLQGHHNEVRFRNVWISVLDLDVRPSPAERR